MRVVVDDDVASYLRQEFGLQLDVDGRAALTLDRAAALGNASVWAALEMLAEVEHRPVVVWQEGGTLHVSLAVDGRPPGVYPRRSAP